MTGIKIKRQGEKEEDPHARRMMGTMETNRWFPLVVFSPGHNPESFDNLGCQVF
jgi:hypothetical protein